MNEKIISRLCLECFGKPPRSAERCGVGLGNYVYIVEYPDRKYVARCSREKDAYENTVYWLQRLSSLKLPIPAVIAKGNLEGYEYLILSYLEGEDLGLAYPRLREEEKKAIAKEVVQIQNKVATLKIEDIEENWSWCAFVEGMLDRAHKRIVQNGYFDAGKVACLKDAMESLSTYFAGIKPIAYLDDISSKNLLIHKGRVSGIIDIDWIGIGDKLTFAALTNMALLNMEYDTSYVNFILKEFQLTDLEKKAFLFYTLMYCVDFMGERGMRFMDKTVEVNETVIDRLNGIWDRFWGKFDSGSSSLSKVQEKFKL